MREAVLPCAVGAVGDHNGPVLVVANGRDALSGQASQQALQQAKSRTVKQWCASYATTKQTKPRDILRITYPVHTSPAMLLLSPPVRSSLAGL